MYSYMHYGCLYVQAYAYKQIHSRLVCLLSYAKRIGQDYARRDMLAASSGLTKTIHECMSVCMCVLCVFVVEQVLTRFMLIT